MFTGLIREIGKLRACRERPGLRELEIAAPHLASSLRIGDSVAVNGVCQTLTALVPGGFTVQALGDTLHKTTLGWLRPGAALNLEPALRLGDSLDGHLVQGHVNGMARCLAWRSPAGAGSGRYLYLELPLALAAGLVPEGSISIDGVSLTVAEIGGQQIAARACVVRISVIPHTLEQCTLGQLKPGQVVNIETDLLLRRPPVFTARAGALAPSGRQPAAGLNWAQMSAWGYS